MLYKHTPCVVELKDVEIVVRYQVVGRLNRLAVEAEVTEPYGWEADRPDRWLASYGGDACTVRDIVEDDARGAALAKVRLVAPEATSVRFRVDTWRVNV